jgi:uncharacterized protein (TIGR02145 family)
MTNYRLAFFVIFLTSLIACKTEEPQNPPTVITKVASDVTIKNATLNGEVTEEGFSATTDRGFVFSEKNTSPSVGDSKAQSGYGKGIYSVVLDKLTANTKYYFKAYATNTKGTSYGEVQSFTTADYKLPTVVTDVPKNITYTTAELGGTVTDEGGGAVSESGFVVGTNVSPTVADLKFSVTKGKTTIALIVSKLNVNTKYFFRSYAINEKGIAYGNEQSFTTLDYSLATISIDVPRNITTSTVEIFGTISNEGGGNISERGFCLSLNSKPTINDNKFPVNSKGAGTFSLIVAGLKDNTKYFIRSYAINEKGISYSNEQSFTTLITIIFPRDNTTKVVEVKSRTGRIWMDRNLGASQVATSSTDEKAFGDLYQWGRSADGHQLRTSSNSTTASSIDQPTNNNFITWNNRLPVDWRVPQNSNLWQGLNGINNPCPSGYRLPTQNEWSAEIGTWTSKSSEGAFDSPLKLTLAGARSYYDGSQYFLTLQGYYWGSSTSPFEDDKRSTYLLLYNINAQTSYSYRINGYSLRCIKD